MVGLAAAPVQNGLQLLDEVIHVLEFAVHGSKSDEGDFVEFAEGIEHEFADASGGDFAFAVFVDGGFDVANEGIDLFGADGAFVAGFFDTETDFFAVEGNASAIFFDDTNGRFFDPFVGGEATFAAEAFSAAADGKILAGARIDDFGFVVSAVRTTHGCRPLLNAHAS